LHTIRGDSGYEGLILALETKCIKQLEVQIVLQTLLASRLHYGWQLHSWQLVA